MASEPPFDSTPGVHMRWDYVGPLPPLPLVVPCQHCLGLGSPNMSARFTLTDAEWERAHTERSPLTQACVDATRELLNAGGTGNVDGRTYEFHGPAQHVRKVVSAYMEFLSHA